MVETGIIGQCATEVTFENTAKALGSGTVQVFATPAMVLLIEKTASESVAPFLDEGKTSVGTYLDVKHTSATPVGMTVRCRTELIEVDRARLRFSVTVVDDAGEVGVGFHERFVVDAGKFESRAKAKL